MKRPAPIRDWYRIEANASTEENATIHVYDAIGGWFGIDAADFVRELEALEASRITLYLNSPGGIAFDGIAMRNALARHAATVDVVVDGLAASAASIVAMAGDTITMGPGAQLMIHNGSAVVYGDAGDMRATADVLDKLDADMAGIYQRRAGGTVSEWRTRMAAETWYSAQEAVDAGLADVAPDPADDDTADDPTARFDLTVYAYAGRHHAPNPTAANPATEGKNMIPDTITAADLEQIENRISDLSREVAATAQRPAPVATGEKYASMGGLLKAIAAGDTEAAAIHAAYTGATTDDTVMKPSYVGEFIHLVEQRRRIVNDFTTGTLPPDGMSVDYVQLKTDTTQVAEQAKQGDTLAYGKVQLQSANAPVRTYGGYTELSRQAIERATVPTLNTTLRAMALKYASATNAAVGKALTDQITANASTALTIAGTATTDLWLDLIVDAALRYEDTGFTMARLHVSADVFKKLIRLKDGDRRIMSVYGDSVNQAGELNLPQVSGNLANVPVRLLPGTTGVAAFSDPVAIEWLESAGAPSQLQDDNIINLTKQFSIYGYGAVLVPFPAAIVPVKIGA